MADKYRIIREKNTRILSGRMAEVRQDCPTVAALLEEKAELIKTGQAAFRSAQSFADYQKALREIEEAIQQALAAAGYRPDYLQPIYDCPLCRDNGYRMVGGRRQRCSCNAPQVSAVPKLETLSLDLFDASPDPKYHSSQRQNMQKIYAFCHEYCEAFPENEKKNLLFCGGTGLGKSYLAGAMAARIRARGYLSCLVNSYNLMDAFKEKHIGGEPYHLPLHRCDFLVIDDLGTEPIYNNITVEYLFALLNDRMENHRATLVVTNLSFEDCRERYGERIASRIYDGQNSSRFVFFGRDLRLTK